MKEKEKQAVCAVLVSWAEKHGAEVTSHDDSGGQPYWTLTPADAPKGGDITVCPRRGKPVSPPGNLEVMPGNDLGWFDRFASDPDRLESTLDLALESLFDVRWRIDPGQGLP